MDVHTYLPINKICGTEKKNSKMDTCVLVDQNTKISTNRKVSIYII